MILTPVTNMKRYFKVQEFCSFHTFCCRCTSLEKICTSNHWMAVVSLKQKQKVFFLFPFSNIGSTASLCIRQTFQNFVLFLCYSWRIRIVRVMCARTSVVFWYNLASRSFCIYIHLYILQFKNAVADQELLWPYGIVVYRTEDNVGKLICFSGKGLLLTIIDISFLYQILKLFIQEVQSPDLYPKSGCPGWGGFLQSLKTNPVTFF